jgi:hypothetical protein
MPDSSILAELRETLTRRQGVLSMLSDPYDRRIYEQEIVELKQQIKELERGITQPIFSSGPCGGV